MLLFYGCNGKGEQIIPNETNDNFNVEFLFEVDGVKVYRFEDRGKSIYFTNTNGKCEYTYYNYTGKMLEPIRIQTLCNFNAIDIDKLCMH